MFTVPNLLWLRGQPVWHSTGRESKTLVFFERVGQVAVTGTALLLLGDLQPWSAWSLWLGGAAGLMLLYEIWWARYFRGGRTPRDFYGDFLGIPVAGASLPAAAFLLLGFYGLCLPLIASAVVFGAGHIGIHLAHRREQKG